MTNTKYNRCSSCVTTCTLLRAAQRVSPWLIKICHSNTPSSYHLLLPSLRVLLWVYCCCLTLNKWYHTVGTGTMKQSSFTLATHLHWSSSRGAAASNRLMTPWTLLHEPSGSEPSSREGRIRATRWRLVSARWRERNPRLTQWKQQLALNRLCASFRGCSLRLIGVKPNSLTLRTGQDRTGAEGLAEGGLVGTKWATVCSCEADGAKPRPALAPDLHSPPYPAPCHFLSARRLLSFSARLDSAQLGPTLVPLPSSAVSPRQGPGAGPGPSHFPAPCRSAPRRPRTGYWQRDNLPCQQKKREYATGRLSGEGTHVEK